MAGANTAIKLTVAVDDGQDLRALSERICSGATDGGPPVARIRRSRSPSSSTTSSPDQPHPVPPGENMTNVTSKLLSIMCGPEAPGISQTVAAHDTDAAPEGSPAASGHPLPVAEGGR
jgi:hypothetical protein